ncbi:TnsA endonuclease C terminal [Chryseobacterium carnipullorum]|uniref:heteromeric transposase endonuclease subunit TnsA n=1 Tax=Chryseobacterium carnipullorum TaxID=1124835 RepID=UPI00091027BB|nr:heteromeric transposase endonuclease subunit TnsA [Chryseobacterium carnipullorum]SHL29276.1 TnsA endonuclease C terminal [Chryseobacterium carnipullorum]
MVIISFKKSRKIGKNSFSLTGQISSVKNNSIIEFESQLEMNLTYLLERRCDVSMYCEQPIEIEYFDGNTTRKYIPDFYVQYHNGEQEIIEVKYEKDLLEKKELLEPKFKAAREFCNSNNISFKILTESQINTPQMFNSKFLANYKTPRFKTNLGDIEYILDTLEKLEQTTITNLINECSSDDNRKAELLFHLWYLVSNYLINFNEEEKLSMNTLIWK